MRNSSPPVSPDEKKPRIKILYFSPVNYFKGGAERSLFDLVANDQIEACIAAPEEGPVLDKAVSMGLKTAVIDFGNINSIHRPFTFRAGIKAVFSLIKSALSLKQAAKQHNCSIVHSNGLKAHAINCLSRKLGGSVAVLHIRDIPYTKAEILVWHILYHLCDAMVLVSRACWPGDKLPAKAHVIHNGTHIIAPKTDAKMFDTLRLGFIGRIHPAKGLHLLLDWMSDAIRKGHTNMRLSIRGLFSEDASSYEGDIKSQIEKLSLKDAVEFSGFISDPALVYENIDTVVIPSHIPDPLPRSVMEAMARGIPVLGYPAGGVTDMITDGETGFCVKDSDDFISAVTKLENPQDRSRITENALQRIQKDFSIPTLHLKINALYKDLLTNKY